MNKSPKKNKKTGNEANFYKEELKIKNEMGRFSVAQDNQVGITIGRRDSLKRQAKEKIEKRRVKAKLNTK